MAVNNQRNELQIMYELLVLAKKKPVNKTYLMYQTNLSYRHFIKYLNYLLENEFLEIRAGNPIGKSYFITEKGKKFTENFKSVLDLI